MNRYTGHYAAAGKEATCDDLKMTCSRVSHVNLWDMLDVNRIYTRFETVEGRSTTRQARQEYCYRRFGKYFGDRVLDVGCDRGVIRKLQRGFYVGIDRHGEPDLKADLEGGFLPFTDGCFDTVVCLEVLEHIDSLHQVFSELIRCSRDIVILTLPNCWRQVFGEILLGRSNKAEYGLPPERPRDRHKWFFNTAEAECFVAWQAQKHGLEILEVEYVYNIGDLFAFSFRVGRERVFYYPPRKRQLNGFARFFTSLLRLFEQMVKGSLFMVGRRGRNISVVNVWFVLRKKQQAL